jgi:hypothetical protein
MWRKRFVWRLGCSACIVDHNVRELRGGRRSLSGSELFFSGSA